LPIDSGHLVAPQLPRDRMEAKADQLEAKPGVP